MASLNKCIFIGNLCKDPETRYMSNGEAVTNITIACNETWKDKNGEKQEKAEFVRVTAYRKLAEIIDKYLKKGRPVYIEGKLQTRKWTDKDGTDRYTTEIIANDMKMLGSKPQNSESNSQENRSSNAPAHNNNATGNGFQDFDDDIPF